MNYLKISKHLHILFSATPATSGGPAKVSSANSNLIDRIENDIHRMRRTIYLLISMGLVFCVCWLPLNIVNLVSLPDILGAIETPCTLLVLIDFCPV